MAGRAARRRRNYLCVWYDISHVPGRLVLHDKKVLGSGELTEVKVWRVPRDEHFPTGVKVSFAYVREEHGTWTRVYGIDNKRGKGLHEHVGGDVRPLPMTDWETLLRSFYEQVQKRRS